MNDMTDLLDTVNMDDFHLHVVLTERSLVRLLDQLHREERRMTSRERRRFSIGVLVLACCSGETTEQVIASLLRTARRDRERSEGAIRMRRDAVLRIAG